MVALSQRHEPVSIVRSVVTKLADVTKRSRTRRTGPGIFARLWWFLTDITGTALAFGAFATGAFVASPWAGWLVVGVGFLALDFRRDMGRRKRTEPADQ